MAEIIDTTPYRQLEDQLKACQEKLRNLFENIPDIIYSISPDGLNIRVNPHAQESFGYRTDGSKGAHLAFDERVSLQDFHSLHFRDTQRQRFSSFVHPSDISKFTGTFEEAVKSRTEFIRGLHYRILFEDGSVRWNELNAHLRFDEGGDVTEEQGVIRDITDRKKAEQALEQREDELKIKTKSLEEVNTALRVLLKVRKDEKAEFEENVLLNVKQLVLPYVQKLRMTPLDATQRTYLDIMESNLLEIVSPFWSRLAIKHRSLTPAELQVANLVKDGRTTKEIASLLNLSHRTIETHRKKIRMKVGLDHKKVNLRAYLMSVS